MSDNGLGGNLGAEFSGNGGITQDKVEQARKGRLSGLKSKNLLIWREENPEAVLAASSKVRFFYRSLHNSLTDLSLVRS